MEEAVAEAVALAEELKGEAREAALPCSWFIPCCAVPSTCVGQALPGTEIAHAA